ncbi:hypothetical protein PND81_06405 [Flavonifractor plautii]|jgi:hypothetical protein|uniref:30S ribosomal protein S1 n=1 Tax=Flavonifractor plautii TaxID=292800 RepID=A0AAW6CF55_FLAPL|nr:hypothetical protein [Flavonifractor plautii]MDB7900939.1 hypothetical protein [Flavonifractor plautii]MDB7927363.1 hypothetical protein [Flavonifractor plautii]MDB7932120.1 hypothetical protein [Flavonifractor plautii]MDB7937187.1 hypothetical protein [Flavonifractor plautii]
MARKKTIPTEEPEQLHPPENPEETAGEAAVSEFPLDGDDAECIFGAGPPEVLETQEGGPEQPPEKPEEGKEAAGDGDTPPADAASAAPAPILDLSDTEQREEEIPQDTSNLEDAASQDGTSAVFSVDLSETVPAPAGGETPEDLDRLLEDPACSGSVVPQTRPLTPAGNAQPGDMPAAAAPPAPEKSDRQKFYELKFNRLDRDLTPEERQEWNSIYASYRGRSALTGTIIGVDPFSVQVRNPATGMMEKQTMYCAIVVPYRVRIVIPSSEMWEKDKERPDFVLQNMVGSTIDFIIIKVDREAGFAIGSRCLAGRSQRYFFAHRPNLNAIGAKIKCRMLSVGPRRCLVDCYGHDIGLTQRELRYTAIPDLRTEYHPGQELDCIVKLYDPDTDRLEISVKETESNPFDGAEQRHPVGARRLAMIAGKYGGGVFCNLTDGTVCMCNYSYQHEDSDFLVGDNVMLIVQRFDAEKRQMYGKILTKW